ncbi:MAG TPA: RdgB/HAM1 family non-canonical purine NTP pyrophosphatase [Cyclobacteriaceae bacterium]|jgi:XTP/dITP diphosphohydrolase|nr:RdgB/HAM1 family non-canonical purine NTP pyrophosphatase [Cyclobacteriaceae bacterium]
MNLCFATNNEHKLSEVKSILGGKFQIVSLQEIGCVEELAETTGTISGNSAQKAEYVYKNYKVDCFADDSGLEVTALNNAPGVDSAIYAGPQRSHDDNIKLLLKNLEGIENRTAHFITVITLIKSGKQFQFEGVLSGQILNEGRGSGGFGYDPIFVPDGYDKTLAQMTMEEKNRISHRARAVEKLVSFLESNY